MGLSFDVGIVGAGIQGAGVAQAAAAAGYRVVVWEKTGIASGTSSRSSKLIHGGLRYLESGQFSLVRKSLQERALLFQNAPSLVHPVPFYIPIYPNTQRRPWQIRLGLSLYALLGNLQRYARYKKVQSLSLAKKDGLRTDGLQSLFQYWDGQTDDAALTRAVMQSAQSLGAQLYCPVEVLSIKRIDPGYRVNVGKSGAELNFSCNTIVNASGPWVNHVLDIVEPGTTKLEMDLVQGTHIIVDDPAPSGIYYLEAPQDQRAVFVMPWHGKTMIGTTETAFTGDEPAIVEPQQSEIDYLLRVYRAYFHAAQANVVKAFAGLRVLPRQDDNFFNRPRDTVVHRDDTHPGLVSLYGGKLTGYRKTAEEVVHAIQKDLPAKTRVADTRKLDLQ